MRVHCRPPAPVHASMKSVSLVSAPVEALPEVALLPVQPPEAVHELAFVVLQLSAPNCQRRQRSGWLSTTRRAGTTADAVTVTVTPWEVVPPTCTRQ